MKRFATILMMLFMLLSQPAVARSILAEMDTTEVGDRRIALHLNPALRAGQFDTVFMSITGGPFQQVGTPGELIIPPSEDSGFSAFLTAPASFGGKGLSAFGVDASTDTTTAISGTFSSLGDNSASARGSYLLAQVVTPSLANLFFTYEFFDDGLSVGGGDSLRLHFLPEPGSSVLLMLGCAALLVRCRESAYRDGSGRVASRSLAA